MVILSFPFLSLDLFCNVVKTMSYGFGDWFRRNSDKFRFHVTHVYHRYYGCKESQCNFHMSSNLILVVSDKTTFKAAKKGQQI